EMFEKVVADEQFPEELQEVPHGDGRMSELEYRLHWARTHLKGIGAMENSSRGVWAVTDKGQSLTEDRMHVETKAWRAQLRVKSQAREEAEDSDEDVVTSWKDQLVVRLLQLPPAGFERLAQRVLREAGFVNVEVTGRTGDGGIDGVGTYRLSLVSFPVFFQCKRYKGSITAGTVRDFRGAMVGRGEKGLLITTGSFTRDAQREATRDGAPPVELIDGDRLCDLLKEQRLGVAVTERIEEDVVVLPDFFQEFD
ncbi:MAG: Mrr restriction system protein, partial [Actinomycetota bacterium]